MQLIKGIYEYHVLCLPCHFKMGLTMEDTMEDSIIQSRLHGESDSESEYDMYCHVSYHAISFFLSFPVALKLITRN